MSILYSLIPIPTPQQIHFFCETQQLLFDYSNNHKPLLAKILHPPISYMILQIYLYSQ